jgi:hypothetical protein
MVSQDIVRYVPSPRPVPEVRITTNQAKHSKKTLMPRAIVYVSLALAIYIVIRGDTAQLALVLPYLAGLLQLVLKANTAQP